MKQTKNTLARIVATAAGASALLIAGAAQAALQDRDLDGDSVVDAFYDTDLDITWLRDANVNGRMKWADAVAWADSFSFAGYTDWRLPTVDPSCRSARNCVDAEMGHLWYVELGNTYSMSNTGNFRNLQSSYYWSGNEYTPDRSYAWDFYMPEGFQRMYATGFTDYAMAVRPGDVPAIPEPQTYALMLAGLAALTMVRRRRTR